MCSKLVYIHCQHIEELVDASKDSLFAANCHTPVLPPCRYNPQTNEWEEVAPMLARRKHLGAAALNGKLYAAGGRNDTTELSSVESYNPLANQWTSVVAMATRRSGIGLAVVNKKLIAVGGFDGTTYLKSMEWYDDAANQWRVAENMNYRRLGGGVGVLPGYMV